MLNSYAPIRGSYGFRIVIQGVSASSDTSASVEKEETIFFTDRDMYGNVYAFVVPYNQQKVIDITGFLNIRSIKIYFYQDFNFADNLNRPIDYEPERRPPDIPPNISFNNLNVYLGVSAEDIKEDAGLLYTYDSLGYNTIEQENNEWICNEQKELHLSWVHYENDNTYSVIDELEELLNQAVRAKGKKTHIFWYRYDYDTDITNEEKDWSQWHKDWSDLYNNDERYSNLIDDWNADLNNPDYESQMTRYAGLNWTFLPYATDNFDFTFTPRGFRSREKIKVVIQHDGSHTTSQELVFKNTRDIEGELSNNARNDFIVLKCFKLDQIKDTNNKWTGEYTAVENGSINAFYVYDENNRILTDNNNKGFDKQEYYMQIQARNLDSNKYEPLETVTAGDNGTYITTGTTISWAFPRSYSMIKTIMEVTPEDAKYFGIDAATEIARYENFHNNTVKFNIQSIYNNSYLDNTIGAVITKNDKEYYIEKEFMFGRAEGLGHEFLPIIEIIHPYGGSYLPTYETDFLIGCAVYNKDGSLFEAPSTLTFSWREISGTDFYHYVEDGKINGYQITSYADALPAAEKDDVFTKKYKGYSNNVIKGRIKTEKDANGNEITKPPIFEVTVYGAASYPLTVRKGFMICNNYTYKQLRDITVPSRVEFKSDGAQPIYYSNPFEIAYFQKGEGNRAEYTLEHPDWHLNNNKIFELKENDVIVNNYSTDKKNYSLKFITNGNPQWNDNYLNPEYYTYIYCNNNGNYLAQAIAFDRNYYPSSLVNDWDGASLTWDEESGAILSTMIAAGVKDNNNKFTGIMMGDWKTKGDESLATPGLYGYDKGEQSFGFKTDGSGFIGNSGKGRIEFDGNKALITNADKTCYINLNPMQKNLIGDSIYAQDSFSQNFLYCKVPKATSLINSIANNIEDEEASWAKSYLNDNVNDYFIVDPNYGVLTTGGVIARYGKIGNWMISNAGLYQKDIVNHKFMYLGFSTMSEEDYTTKCADAAKNYTLAIEQLETDYANIRDAYLKEYNTRLDDWRHNKDISSQLNNWYDLIHYYSIGAGLAQVSYFLNKCLEKANGNESILQEYYNQEVETWINSFADKSQHKVYNEYGEETAKTHQTGYSLTMTDILKNNEENNVVFTTYYNDEVSVDTVKDFTVEEFEKIIDQCNIGTIIFETSYQHQLEEARLDYPDKIRNIYNYKIDNANKQFNNDKQKLEDNYNTSLNELNEDYLTGGNTYCIYAGQSESDFNKITSSTEPYFSVSWDGTLYARKGTIARTWEINNSGLIYLRKSLTDSKKYDKIYIGLAGKDNQPNTDDCGNEAIIEEDYDAIKIIEEEKEKKGENYISYANNRWAISAGEQTFKDDGTMTDYINFGVSPEGELYSRFGSIGSWVISPTTLSSVPRDASGKININGNKIILDAKENVIKFSNESFMVDGTTGTVKLGVPYGDGDTIGLVYIANFLLSGKTPNDETSKTLSFTDIDFQNETTTVGTSTVLSGSTSWGNASINITSTPISSASTALIPDLGFTLSKDISYFQIIEDKKNDTGIVLAVGEKDNQPGVNAAILYPVNDGDVLGITGHKWNIVAKNITAKCIDVDGSINGTSLYMDYEKVATQKWVKELLEEIWDAIDEIWDAIKKLESDGYKNTVKYGNWNGSKSNGNGTGTLCFSLYNAANNLLAQSTGIGIAYASHGHTFNLTVVGGKLSLAFTGKSADETDNYVDISHTHTGSATFNEDGTVTITLNKSFSNATSEIIKSNSVVGTSWYKNKLTTLWTGMYTIDKLEGQTVTVTIKRASMDGVTFEDKVRTVDVKSVYNDGYDEGYDEGYDDGRHSVPSVDKRGIWKEGWAAGKAGLSQSDCPY